MAIINKRAGHQMCEVREKLGLTMRDVYRLSKQIANSLFCFGLEDGWQRVRDLYLQWGK